MATGIAVHPTRAAIERRSRWWQPALVVAGIALAGAWLWLLYELSRRAHYDSDHANMVLSGRDFIGNPLLRDWVLPGDPFWLTYIPLFGLAAIFVGTGSTAMHLVYVVVTGAILAAAWWTIGRQHRGAGRWLGAALVALLVGLPHPVLSQYLLTNLHAGTALVCLAGASLLVHHPRRPAWWAGVLLLAAAVVSDPFGIVMGVLPVACAGLAATLRQRRWTPVLTAAAATLLAGGAAPLARWALRGAGGFGLAPALPLAPSSYRLDNLRSIPETMGALLGVGPASGLSGAAATARAVGAALFVLGILIAAARLVAGIIRGPSREEAGGSSSAWLDDVLFAGTLGVLATFVVVVLPPRDLGSVRYLIPALILGGLLAGRQLAWVATGSRSAAEPPPASAWPSWPRSTS